MRESLNKKKYYEVDRGLSLLFKQLYGEEGINNLEQSATLSDYKKQFSKLLATIKRAFNDTCKNTDKSHLKELNEIIKNQISVIRSIDSVEEMYQSLMVFFPRLCFLLIGNIPQNWSSRQKNNRSSWYLNEFRQVEYKQNRKQKVDLIIDLLKNNQIKGVSSYNEEYKNYTSSHLKDESFFKWFVRTYPLVYIETFEIIK